MELITNNIQCVNYKAFANENDLSLVITERALPKTDPARFFATFKGAEVKENGCLTSTFGNGNTPSMAIKNYLKRIALKTIVIGAYTKTRKEIAVPRLKFQ